MGIVSSAHRMIDLLTDLPGIRQWRMKRYEDRFATHVGHNVFRGVFDSYEEAARSAPHVKPLGYDNGPSARIYVDRTARILPSDYPAMHWLARFWADHRRTVFDVGGNIGVSYYAYQRLLDYPDDLQWTVFDVPTIVALGREIAAARDARSRLAFAENFRAAADSEILLANGALQFLPDEFGDLLRGLAQRPSRLIINRIPLHPTRGYFTLQSIGTAFCPYRVLRKADFLGSLRGLGYEVLDEWRVADLDCEIPFHEAYSVRGYCGFALAAHGRA